LNALAYLREHRGLMLQWFGVLAGPSAWSAQFIVSYNVTDTGACAPAGARFLASGGFRPVVAVVSALAAAVTALVRSGREDGYCAYICGAGMAAHLAGESTLEDAVNGTVKRTKALARRQMAWFRRDPRIRWFEAGPEGAAALTDEIVEYLRS